MNKLELVTDARCIVGEGPIWDEAGKRLLMVDIQGKRLRSINWQTGAISERVLDQQTGFLFLGSNGQIYGGAEDGIYEIKDDGIFVPVAIMKDLKGERLNDGKVGPDGRLYFGSFSRDYSAAFYVMDEFKNISLLFDGVGNSNGLDFDVKRNVMYYNDTPTKRTDCFAFDMENGILSQRKPIIEYQNGNPDGMTIDTDGNLWVALWGAGIVACVNPQTNQIIEKVELPVSQPACCTFAGSDMKTLVITTAAHNVNLREEPLAGAVFSVKTNAQGIKPYTIDIKNSL